MATKRRTKNPAALAPGEIPAETIAPSPEPKPSSGQADDNAIPDTGTPTTLENLDLTEEQMPAETGRTSKWPVHTERRSVNVKFTTEERAEMADEMGKVISRREDIRAEKKNTAARHQSSIDDLDKELSDYSSRLAEGGREKMVPCTWVFECSGKDEFGQEIYHPEMKALIRDETGEVVSVAKISDHDRQMDLALLHETPPQEGEQAESEDGGALDLDLDLDIGDGPPINDPAPEPDHEKIESPTYVNGWDAYDSGASREDCGYPEGSTEAADWLRGWDASKEASAE